MDPMIQEIFRKSIEFAVEDPHNSLDSIFLDFSKKSFKFIDKSGEKIEFEIN